MRIFGFSAFCGVIYFCLVSISFAQSGGQTVWKAQTGSNPTAWSHFFDPWEACEAAVDHIKQSQSTAWGNVSLTDIEAGPTSDKFGLAYVYGCLVSGPTSAGPVSNYNLVHTYRECFTGDPSIQYANGNCETTKTCVSGDQCCMGTSFGNPIDALDGTKLESAVDWVSPLDSRLRIDRHYLSDVRFRTYGTTLPFSGVWSLSLLQELRKVGLRRSGYNFDTLVHYRTDGGTDTYKAKYDFLLGAYPLVHNTHQGKLTGWSGRTLAYPSGQTVQFSFRSGSNSWWKADSVTWADGYVQTFIYDGQNRLDSVTDNKDQVIQAEWVQMSGGSGFTPNLLSKLNIGTVLSGGGYSFTHEVRYSYGPQVTLDPNVYPLEQVDLYTSSGVFIRTLAKYEYETLDDNVTYSQPKLIEVYDGRPGAGGGLQLKSIFAYDSDGQAISTEHVGGTDKFSMVEVAGAGTVPDVEVTNPLGKKTVLEFAEDNTYLKRILRLKKTTGVATTNCLGTVKELDYTPNTGAPDGLVYARIERNGSRTEFERDSMGRITRKTEDATGTSPRVTDYTWNTTTRRLQTRTTAHLEETFSYDSNGLLTSYTQKDVLAGSPDNGKQRTWTYGYTTLASGLKVLTSVDGPGLTANGVTDVVAYQYDSLGRLTSSTDENGLVTTVLQMNGYGQPTRLQNPDGVIWEFTYDDEGRLLTSGIDTGSGITNVAQYSYDEIGQLVSTTDMYSGVWQNEYDGARRLVKITAPDGTTTDLSYDAMGNVTGTSYNDASLIQTYLANTNFDELGRILEDVRGPGRVWSFAHDVEDNLTSVTDPQSNSATQVFDSLNRLASMTDRAGYTSTQAHNEQDQLTSYTDPRTLSTQFTYNGFGDALTEVSPDRGTMSYQYNDRGLVSQMTDARSIVSTYEYDDGGRLTARRFPAFSAEDETFTYDNVVGTNISGRGKIWEAAKQGDWVRTEYDQITGLPSNNIRSIDGTTYNNQHYFDEDGRLTRMDYPSGRQVLYGYDSTGQVSSVQQVMGGVTSDIATSITYLPFGPLTSMTYGDGAVHTRSYDSSYRLTELKDVLSGTTLRHITLGYDTRDDLTTITDNLNAPMDEAYTYTLRQKLDTAAGDYGTLDFGYDGVGNRISLARSTPTGIETDTYVYPSTSNRLDQVQIAGTTNRDMLYDAAGNLISDDRPAGLFEFDYDAAGRMIELSKTGVITAEYRYNTQGQMTWRLTPSTGAEIHVIHDLEGNRIAEYDGDTGQVLIEYVWLGGEPIAAISGGNTSFLRTDHIGRVVLATDSLGVVTTSTAYKPFGAVHSSTGTDYGLRFPGQVYHWESELYQNWMRDYDPSTGRYLQGDPLGLVDGASVYGYALQSPARYTDPTGEYANILIPIIRGGVAICTRIIAKNTAKRAAQGAMSQAQNAAKGAGIAGGISTATTGTEACGCEDDCPSPAEAAKLARKKGAALTAAFKASGVGTGAGRSGGHGTPAKRAGAEMIRLGNDQTCATLKAAYKAEGKRLINKGKGTNHR